MTQNFSAITRSYGYAQKPGAGSLFPPVERTDPETPPDHDLDPDTTRRGFFYVQDERYAAGAWMRRSGVSNQAQS